MILNVDLICQVLLAISLTKSEKTTILIIAHLPRVERVPEVVLPCKAIFAFLI